MTLKLVSFTTCPFVQRAVLMLREKQVDFDVDYIDLSNKPAWFLEQSPRGKVPILIVDAPEGTSAPQRVLFESGAICEYLEETNPTPRLFPEDPVWRARDRAWFTFSSEEMFLRLWQIETAKDRATLDGIVVQLQKQLAILEAELDGKTWLSGDGTRFGMADVGMSSAFYRMQVLKRDFDLDLTANLPRVRALQERIWARETVQASVPSTWDEDHRASMERAGSVLLAR